MKLTNWPIGTEIVQEQGFKGVSVSVFAVLLYIQKGMVQMKTHNDSGFPPFLAGQ